MKKKKKEKFTDDGRTIADMNVEGMPWYNQTLKENRTFFERESESRDISGENEKLNLKGEEKLTFKENLQITKGVLAASLLVALVFILVFSAFILFCIYVWF